MSKYFYKNIFAYWQLTFGLIVLASLPSLVYAATTGQGPVANAGNSQTLTLPINSTTLSGSGTDDEGSIASYVWTQVSGPNAAIFSSKAVAKPTITNLVGGVYTFSLVVSDSQGLMSAPGQVVVAVISCRMDEPLVTSPVSYCVGAQAQPLSQSVKLASNARLFIYTAASGGTMLPSDFRPPVWAAGSATYYISQVVGSCESVRVALQVNVAAPPAAPALVPAAGVDPSHMACWGDSFTDAVYGLYPKVLGQLTGCTVYNGGIGGQTSVQIKDRFLADVSKRSWPTLIWAGRNDTDQPDQVLASVAAMVAALPHRNFVVLGLCNGSWEGKGEYGYGLVTTINQRLAAAYGSHYMPVREFLVSQYDASSAQDVADHQADIPPSSLRQDGLHPNASGCTLIANYVYAHLSQLWSVDYCQGAAAEGLSARLRLAAGASVRTYGSASAGDLQVLGGGDLRPSTASVGSVTYYVSQVVGSCESGRTALTVNVASCAATTAAAPASLSTLDVYPMPVSAQTVVSFRLTQPQPYAVELYDMTGHLLKHLAQGQGQAGILYSYPLEGQSLHEGLYIVRLMAGKDSKSTRLIMGK